MAMVSRYAMRDPTFRDLAAARLYPVTVHTPNGVQRYDVFNLNRLLGLYRGADGVKIGYTENALRTIVASATRDGHRVYAAVLGSTNLWADSQPLLDYAFKNFQWPEQPAPGS
jgi:D-alanyl-D-alanine carboxypeptidase